MAEPGAEVNADGLDRLRRANRFQPLLAAWAASGSSGPAPLVPIESDVLTLVLVAVAEGSHLQIPLPGGGSRLPLLAAVAAAADHFVNPGRTRPGPVAFVTRSVLRRSELEQLDAAGSPVAAALAARRLRSDGFVCRSGGGGQTLLDPAHHLLFVSPATGFPDPLGTTVGAVVVDDTDDPEGALTVQACDWADRFGAPKIVFSHLGAGRREASLCFPLDWPFLRTGLLPPGLEITASAASGRARAVVVDDSRMAPLSRARGVLGRLGRRSAPWPAPLAAASRFARLLVDLAVPPDLYDAYTVATIATTLARRRDELEETPPSALSGAWRDVAETDWAPLKSDLFSAYDALAEVNHKANALGLVVEELLDADETVDVICPGRVAAAATRNWLLQAGFATADAALQGRLGIRSSKETCSWGQKQVTVLPGMPPSRSAHRLVDGDVGRLVVVSYPLEATHLSGAFSARLSAGLNAAAVARAETVAALMGAPAVLPGIAYAVHVEASVSSLAGGVEAGGWLDATDAERAAFDDFDDWDDGTDGDGADGTGARWVPARALILVGRSGPTAVLVSEGARLDRIAGGRVMPVRPAALTPGMVLVGFTGSDRRALFARLRPHLDTLQGPGAAAYLEVWRVVLRQAVDRCRGSAALAARLRAAGADVRDPAVASWSSPYRIGPRDPRNIARVAAIAGFAPLEANAARTGRVMEAVRRLHRKVGVRVAEAVRAAADGRPDAFDQLESQLGVEVAELLGDLTPWTVTAVSESGWARRSQLWRALTPAVADAAFRPGPHPMDQDDSEVSQERMGSEDSGVAEPVKDG